MNTPLEWLKAVPTTFAGTVYEPWIGVLTFMLVAVLICSFIARILMRPPMSALARQTWALLEEADATLKHATLYAPEVEHYRQRTAPYVLFILHIGQLAAATILFGVGLVVLAFSVRPGVPWYSPVIISLFLSGAAIWGRISFAFASWQWHAIKTGEERPPRKPQGSLRREVIDNGPLSIIPDDEPRSLAS